MYLHKFSYIYMHMFILQGSRISNQSVTSTLFCWSSAHFESPGRPHADMVGPLVIPEPGWIDAASPEPSCTRSTPVHDKLQNPSWIVTSSIVLVHSVRSFPKHRKDNSHTWRRDVDLIIILFFGGPHAKHICIYIYSIYVYIYIVKGHHSISCNA